MTAESQHTNTSHKYQIVKTFTDVTSYLEKYGVPFSVYSWSPLHFLVYIKSECEPDRITFAFFDNKLARISFDTPDPETNPLINGIDNWCDHHSFHFLHSDDHVSGSDSAETNRARSNCGDAVSISDTNPISVEIFIEDECSWLSLIVTINGIFWYCHLYQLKEQLTESAGSAHGAKSASSTKSNKSTRNGGARQ